MGLHVRPAHLESTTNHHDQCQTHLPTAARGYETPLSNPLERNCLVVNTQVFHKAEGFTFPAKS